MARFRIFSTVLAVASVGVFCASMAAQAVQDSSGKPLKSRPIPEASRLMMPFPLDSGPQGSARAIAFRSADQMTQEDRDLEAGAEPSIAEEAGFADLDFKEGSWSYRQLVCPALPHHLFLRFTRNGGAGDVSVFFASIPRGGQGRVRIVPLQRRGYSLFSPAPVNALTIAAFNRIRAEEPQATGWLGTALCYAALAGENPALPDEVSGDFSAASSAVLEILSGGGAIVRFTDGAALPRPMAWTLTFDGKGKLLKAAQVPASQYQEKKIPPARAGLQGRPIPAP
jgi:hypothetical protein